MNEAAIDNFAANIGFWSGECVDVVTTSGEMLFGLVKATPARNGNYWAILTQDGHLVMVPVTSISTLTLNAEPHDPEKWRVPK